MSAPTSQWTRQVKLVRKEGFDEGLAKGRQEIIDWLEAAYLGAPDRPDRDTPEAKAILKLAEDAAKHFKAKTKPKKKGARK